jgi:hypothetical protein
VTVIIVAVVAVVIILVIGVGLLRARRATGVATRRTSATRAELSTAREELRAERERTEDLGHRLRDAQEQVADAKETARLLAGQEAKPAPALRPAIAPVSRPPEPAATPEPIDTPEPIAPPEPAVTDPAATDPAATDPAATDPAASEPVEATAGNHGEALDALWSLTRIRQEWAGRQTATIGLTDEPARNAWASSSLSDVLAEEVARIREDTGTPGTLRLTLPAEPRPADAVLLVLSIQALLDALSRHCQGYDLYVHEWEQRLTAIVVCEGFDGPDRVAADASALLGAISPAGGDVTLDRDAQGRLRARLSLTVSPR